jgi:hypothetical protein
MEVGAGPTWTLRVYMDGPVSVLEVHKKESAMKELYAMCFASSIDFYRGAERYSPV